MFAFAQPWWFLLVLVWPIGYALQRRFTAPPKAIVLPTASALAGNTSWRVEALRRLPWLLHIILGLMVVALARPQKVWTEEKINSNGIDIVLTMDISLSMLSRDFMPNRLAVAKAVAIDFVSKRPNDRIGLVVFAGEAFTHCPLTPDKKVVKEFIQNIRVGVLKWETAIGDGLVTALSRIRNSPAKSKIIVLLTDGDSNAGMDPKEAAEIAVEMGIKVYTIAIGKEGLVETPYNRIDDTTFVYQYAQSYIKTDTLQQIADMTHGRFFRAYSPEDLEEIYDEIDRLEKTNIDVTTIRRSSDYFQYLIGAAFVLLLAFMLIKWVVLRSVRD
jgi:Ca-activated chloride channel homolog